MKHEYSGLRISDEALLTTLPVTASQMPGMEQWMVKDKTDFLEELLGKLKEDDLEPNIYTYNGIIYV